MITGGCSCGKIRWSHPGPKTSNLLCHCDECRRGVAGAFSAVMGLATDQLKVEGPWQDYRYTSASSRGFCSECGTRLWFRSNLWSGDTYVNVGTLDNPQAYVPDSHVVYGEKICWATPADGVAVTTGFSADPEEGT